MTVHNIKNVEKKIEAAHRGRFRDCGNVKVTIGSAGYGYATDQTGRRARYDLSAWRIRFVEVLKAPIN